MVLSGLQRVAEAAGKGRQSQLQNFWKYSSLKNVTIPETPIGLKDVTTKELTQKTMMVLDNTAVFGQVTIYYKNDYTCENVKLLWLFQLHSATKVIILNEYSISEKNSALKCYFFKLKINSNNLRVIFDHFYFMTEGSGINNHSRSCEKRCAQFD
jgi:hypothetical protein